jgi:hypothetical protein
MDPGFVQLVGSGDAISPQPSELESLDELDVDDDGGPSAFVDERAAGLLAETDSRTLNFVGATIRDASYPGDGGALWDAAGGRSSNCVGVGEAVCVPYSQKKALALLDALAQLVW